MLTLSGDTAIRQQSGSTPPSSPPAVRNLGVLSLPRGFSLTVAGGIEQGSRGEAVIALPAPLYAPSPAPRRPEARPADEAFGDRFRDDFGDRLGGRLGGDFGGDFGDRFGTPFGAGGGRHPLEVERGVARLEGAVNASVSRGGGEDERWVFWCVLCK